MWRYFFALRAAVTLLRISGRAAEFSGCRKSESLPHRRAFSSERGGRRAEHFFKVCVKLHGKEKSTERIDGAVATVMALDRTIRNEGSTDSVYDERGIVII